MAITYPTSLSWTPNAWMNKPLWNWLVCLISLRLAFFVPINHWYDLNICYAYSVPTSIPIGKSIQGMKSFPCLKFRALLYFSPIVKRILVSHYTDVIMTTMASQITSLTVVYSNVYSDTDQRKHQSSASLAFVWGIHRDRWIPRTKGQLRGKCFHLMTLSCELVGYGHMFFLNYASITTVSSGVYNYSYLPPSEVPSLL